MDSIFTEESTRHAAGGAERTIKNVDRLNQSSEGITIYNQDVPNKYTQSESAKDFSR